MSQPFKTSIQRSGTLNQFFADFFKLSEELKGYSGLFRDLALRQFNCQWLNPEFYQNNPANPHFFQAIFENNLVPPKNIWHDILDFCIQTEACQSLGMSLLDFASLDVATFLEIKSRYEELEAPKITKLKELQERLNQASATNRNLSKNLSKQGTRNLQRQTAPRGSNVSRKRSW